MIQANPSENKPRSTPDAPLVSGELIFSSLVRQHADPDASSDADTEDTFDAEFYVGDTRCRRRIRPEEVRSFRAFQLATLREINALPRIFPRRGTTIDAEYAELVDAGIRKGATQ